MNKKFKTFLQSLGFILIAGGLVWFSSHSKTTESSPKAQLRRALIESNRLEKQATVEAHGSQTVHEVSEADQQALAYKGYQRDLAYHGFTSYPESGSEKIFLVNMSGTVVHEWDFDAARFRILPNCNILVIHGTKWGMSRNPWNKLRYSIREYDFDGNLVWDYKSDVPFHHDVHRLENGNTLAMRRIEVPPQQMPGITNPLLRNLRIRSDELVEVSPDKKIAWSWKIHEHIDPSSCGKYPCAKVKKNERNRKRQYDWSHTNTVAPIPPNKWHKAGDSRFTPGNVMIMPRNLSTAMIVDKKSGDIVWKYQGDYKGGLSYGHEPHMIPEGLPGAGNVLIFDNGYNQGAHSKSSFVLEVNPTTNELVWVYDMGKKFHSQVAGSMQRLPNGNTLISEDVRGRTFEVTPDKKIVWEYYGNHVRSARSHRYAPDYCPRFKDFPLH